MHARNEFGTRSQKLSDETLEQGLFPYLRYTCKCQEKSYEAELNPYVP
jgi:hypothetical protein